MKLLLYEKKLFIIYINMNGLTLSDNIEILQK